MPGSSVIKAAGIIIYVLVPNEFKFLLLKSSDSTAHWTPPKGRLDPGEDDLTAAKRETKEEAGLDADSYEFEDGYSETLEYKVQGGDKQCKYFLAKLKDPNTQIKLSDEHTEFKWVKESEIYEYTDKQSLRDMLKRAHQHLKSKLGSSS